MKFTKQTTFLGRNGVFKCTGLVSTLCETGDNEHVIVVEPITSQGVTGRSNIEIPAEDLPAVIKELQRHLPANGSVKCKSGVRGWKARLQDNYASFEEFESFSRIYGLHTRLDFNTPAEAWDANPIIVGSVEPSDFQKFKS